MANWYHAEMILRDRPGGTGVNSVAVQAYRHADDSTIGSPVLTSTVNGVAGAARFLLATTVTTGSSFELHPGPYYLQLTHNGETQNHSSQDVGSAGVIDLFSQVLLNKAMGNGIIQAPDPDLDEFACTADGLTRTVVVAKGAFTIQGIPGFNHLARTMDIAANASGNPRIDTIVLEVVPRGQATEGKVTLKAVAGTPAGSPVAPTLTQSAVLWQEPLADVAVANGAVVIQLADVTDRRDLIERAVSDVEDDITALDGRLDTIEGGTGIVPGLRLIGWHSVGVDIATMAAHAGLSIEYTVTNLASGVTDFALTDIFIVHHAGFDLVNHLSIKASGFSGGVTVSVSYFNHSGVSYNPIGATQYIWVFRPVTS